MNKTKQICVSAIGIALYVCVSMAVKIPVVGNISSDLGFIVLAVYCYTYGPLVGALVGSCGCFLVSLLATGWIAIGWPIGNFLTGLICGYVYNITKGKKYSIAISLIITVASVFIGVVIIKTVVESLIYSMPMGPKFAKNFVAFGMDAITMCFGYIFIKLYNSRLNTKEKQQVATK